MKRRERELATSKALGCVGCGFGAAGVMLYMIGFRAWPFALFMVGCAFVAALKELGSRKN